MMWTPEMDDALVAGFESGLSSSIVAAQMGVTRNAVIGRSHRLNLSDGEKRKPTMTLRGEDFGSCRRPLPSRPRAAAKLTSHFHLNLPPSWRAKIDEAAATYSAKPSAYVRFAIIGRLKADGFDPEPFT